MDVLTYRPDPAELAWTFGGVPPVRRVRPGGILELWTEDAFGGRVRGPDDLVSRVVEFPYVNPQTGPFYVEGASPGTPWPSTSCRSSRRGTGPPRPPSRCSGP
jgi:amidase